MGLLDKWRQKTNEEINKWIKNKKEQINTETNKIINKRYSANDELTKKQLRDIKQQAGRNVIRRDLIKMGVVTVSCAALGIAGFNVIKDNMKDDLKDKVKTDKDTIIVNPEGKKSELDLLLEDIDNIQDEKATLEFLKEMYLKEYNKENNTDLTVQDIEFVRNSQDYVFDVNGVYVTHGSFPNDTKNKLNIEGREYKNVERITVYSAKKIEDKEILESFAVGGTNGVVDVVYGDEYVNGKTLESNSKNVLAGMSSVMSNGIDLFVGFKNGENENKIELRKMQLSNAVTEYSNRDMYKQIQADIEMGVR